MSVVGCSLITFMGKLFFRKGHVLDPNYFNQVFMQPIFVRPCQDSGFGPATLQAWSKQSTTVLHWILRCCQ